MGVVSSGGDLRVRLRERLTVCRTLEGMVREK